jgi:hypothetical protein
LAKRFKIKHLGIFGSYARGEQRQGSDIDILVSYSVLPGFFGLVEAQDYLSSLLGVKVDLVTEGSLHNPFIAKAVRREVVAV